jgi:16S rRNA (guanine966-N2)-methyltransferase
VNVRITGGSLRGRALPGRVGAGVRPTGARVREALFNILGNDLEGTSVLDATGGSGIIALEAASRGAAPVLVLERDRAVAADLSERVGRLGLSDTVTVVRRDALGPAAVEGTFGIAFADPPYAQDLQPWVSTLLPHAERVLVLEHAARKVAPPAPAGWEADTRRYGDTSLTFYRRSAAPGSGRAPEAL